ncbi:MAG: DNA alkylation repair protein, partial [Chloroflexi bacterium]
LWQSDNHDARILAMRIADPKRADSDTLERWVRELGDYIVTDAFTEYVSRTPFMREKMETWTQSDEEWISTAGWGLLAHMATKDETLDDDYFMGYLDIIRRDIHTRKNRTRYAMNTALICIGTRNDFLEEQAIAAAKAIGKVEVDHGETSCQTPDAVSYIPKSREHRRKKELKKA